MRKTTSMKKIRELLRLFHEGLSQRKAVTCPCISRTVAQEILSKAAYHNLIFTVKLYVFYSMKKYFLKSRISVIFYAGAKLQHKLL